MPVPIREERSPSVLQQPCQPAQIAGCLSFLRYFSELPDRPGAQIFASELTFDECGSSGA
jgi:hypothetical protein